jgi:hypothetical protein
MTMSRQPNVVWLTLDSVRQDHPDVVDELDGQLTEWLETESQQVGEGEDIEVDQSTRNCLADLGYLDSEM